MIAEFVEFLAKGLVTHADAVSVEESERPGRLEVNITVAQQDYGRIIGRGGQTIDAIRALAAVVGRKNGVNVMVDVVDPERPPRRM